jgi:hypothetical protein
VCCSDLLFFTLVLQSGVLKTLKSRVDYLICWRDRNNEREWKVKVFIYLNHLCPTFSLFCNWNFIFCLWCKNPQYKGLKIEEYVSESALGDVTKYRASCEHCVLLLLYSFI